MIPEQQLETWARQGAIQTAADTHQAIRNALNHYSEWPQGMSYDVYLQGSYRNATNIRGDSDVDVVVQLDSVYNSDTWSLDPLGLTRYQNDFVPADYGWIQFRRDVLKALRSYFNDQYVKEGSNSLKLSRTSSHLPADIVVCNQYRKYKRYWVSPGEYIEGMVFWALPDKRMVVNYPKLHYKAGVEKNDWPRTNGNYKRVVRMFKNARSFLADGGLLGLGEAPSYFLECMLFNVPDRCFGSNLQNSYVEVVNWLSGADLDQFMCQNGQVMLFGPNHDQWSVGQATKSISLLIRLWNDR